MERMKVEIDSEELKRLKSREEKYLAYMDMLSYRGEDETYVDALCGKVAELEEENETLKDNVEFLHSCLDDRDKSITIMQEENKKLKKDNRFLTKISKEYMKKENIIQVTEFTGLYKDDLEKENERLREELAECECSFGFENDEVGYRKREYKRLKKWIKDHCKGYGNLFPEDEMKRQWKKANKKRK